MSSDIIRHWLQYLDYAEYGDSFIDNGYDDLETVKLIQKEDLEAIGVTDTDHQEYLLSAVKVLKEQGAAWVYLLDSVNTFAAGDDRSELYADYCPSEANIYGSSGPDSYKSSIYQQSDGTLSEESSGFFPLPKINKVIHHAEITPVHTPQVKHKTVKKIKRGDHDTVNSYDTINQVDVIEKEDETKHTVFISFDNMTRHKVKEHIEEEDTASLFYQVSQWMCHRRETEVEMEKVKNKGSLKPTPVPTCIIYSSRELPFQKTLPCRVDRDLVDHRPALLETKPYQTSLKFSPTLSRSSSFISQHKPYQTCISKVNASPTVSTPLIPNKTNQTLQKPRKPAETFSPGTTFNTRVKYSEYIGAGTESNV